MKRIIIPTDFSDNAGDALRYTLDFVKKEKTEIHIVHVFDPNLHPDNPTSQERLRIHFNIEDAKEALDGLEKFSKIYFEETGRTNVKITTNLMVGSIAGNLTEEASTTDADLIIMGTQGVNHNFVDKLFGTVSSEIIASAPCPVLLIPPDYKFQSIANVIFSTDLNHADPYELWKGIHIIEPHEAIVRCLHVTKDAELVSKKSTQEFSKYLIEHSPSVQTIFYIESDKNIGDAIKEYADTYNAELIIMNRKKKSFIERIFGLSQTKKMAFKIEIPLLIMTSKQ